METGKKQDSSDAAGTSLAAPKSSSRRRLLTAGLGATPAILTIVSQPVRAFGPTALPCRSASAFASITAAQLAGVTTSAAPQNSCLGNGPAGWNSLVASAWPVSKTDALFITYFPSGYNLRGNTSPKLIDVVSLDSSVQAYSQQEIVVRSFVAAMLNSLSGKTPPEVVRQDQLAAMLPQVLAGTYTPIIGGTPWTLVLANQWLLQTFVTP